MSLTARLQFGDNDFRRYSREYLVSDFKCRVLRRHNEARPDRSARCEHLELTVVTPGKDDLNLVEWYLGHSMMSGRILIELPANAQNQSPEWKEVLFENGICYSISEEYHIDRESRRSLKLCIAVEELQIDEIVFKAIQ
ncbi:MAG: hypothetical protein IKX67_02825 [Bacteroidales bacterium]|nr:hypothetical protein [Bacteroidales bacterium]